MATTYELITNYTVGSGGTSLISLNPISSAYTDLLLKISIRGTNSSVNGSVSLGFNGTSTTSNWNVVFIEGSGTSVSGGSGTSGVVGYPPAANATASTFGSVDIYIPNYLSSSLNKTLISDSVGENNGTTAYSNLVTNTWNVTNAITSIEITNGVGNIAQYSTAYLYGIKNS